MRVPKLRKNGDHRAFVEFKKKRIYLGQYGSKDAEQAYQRFLASIFAGNPVAIPARGPATIRAVVAEYLLHAETYYSRNGKQTKEFTNVADALKPLLELYGTTIVGKFGPRNLTHLQSHMVRLGWRHRVVNSRISRIRRVFRWLAQHEYIDGAQFQALLAVPGLRKGQLGVKESRKVQPVSLAHVDATLPYVSPTTAAMIQTQLWCGMRPSETCIMRPCDIDRSGEIWIYRPHTHKGESKDLDCVKAIPKFVQSVLLPFLERADTEYLFKPIESIRWHAARRSNPDERKYPIYPCELRRRQKSRERADVEKRPFYDAVSFRRSVVCGIQKARKAGVDVPHWHPHQLRHAIADYVSETMGEQAAQRWLWHARLETTSIYTQAKVSELLAIAAELDRRRAG